MSIILVCSKRARGKLQHGAHEGVQPRVSGSTQP
jgi:hypothetical protein